MVTFVSLELGFLIGSAAPLVELDKSPVKCSEQKYACLSKVRKQVSSHQPTA